MIYQYRTREHRVHIEAARESSARPLAVDWCKGKGIDPAELYLYSVDGMRPPESSYARYLHEVPAEWEGDYETGREVRSVTYEEWDNRQRDYSE